MKKISIALIFTAVLIILLAGCNFFKPVKIGKLKSFKINQISLQSVNLDITLPVKNPNYFQINVQKLDLDIQVNGMDIGSVAEERNFEIPARSDKELSLNLNLKLKNFFNSTIALMQVASQKEVRVGVKGKVQAKVLMVSKTVEINQEEQVKLN
jgi:LEA14-like dessication related protein